MRSNLPLRLLAAAMLLAPLVSFTYAADPAQTGDPLDGAIVQVQSTAGKTTKYRLAVEKEENKPTADPATAPATSPATKPSTAPAGLSRVVVDGGGGMAPCAVFVNAIGASLDAGSVLTARYEWDFGDPGSPYNSLVGWSAAHVYDKAGKYTITLYLTDETGKLTKFAMPVEVLPDKRSRIYVSAEGDDRRSGLSPDEAIRSFTRVQKIVNSGSEILFRAGDTFSCGGQMSINARNVVIGAYAIDPSKAGLDRPRLTFPGVKNAWMIGMQVGAASEIVVQDLSFDSTVAADDVVTNGVLLAGPNVVVRRCEFLNVGTGINGVRRPGNVLIQDNSSPLVTGLRANFLWAEGNDYVVLGNKVANSTREHCLRFADSGVDRVLIAHNDLTNLDRRSIDPLDFDKKTIVLQNGTYAYVARNRLTDGMIDISTSTTVNSGAADAQRGPLARWHWAVIEANTITNALVDILPNASHLMCRNNAITAKLFVFLVSGHDPRYPERVASDVTIVNNTGVATQADSCFIAAGDGATGIVAANNLYVKTTAPVQPLRTLNGPAQGAFVKIANNVWPAVSKLVVAGSQGDVLEDVKLDAGFVFSSDCKAASAARPFPGVFTDLFNNSRVGDHWSAGATLSRAREIQLAPPLIAP